MKRGLIGVIDGDELDRKIYKKIIYLSSPSYQLHEFSDAREALNYYIVHASTPAKLPDLVLFELRLPFMNGWQYLEEYCRMIPSLSKSIPHFACTTSMDPFDRAFQHSSLQGYYTKPITPGSIVEMIKLAEQLLK